MFIDATPCAANYQGRHVRGFAHLDRLTGIGGQPITRRGLVVWPRTQSAPTWNDGFQRAARGVAQLRIELLPRITTPRYTPPRFGLYKEAHTTQCIPGGPVGVINRRAQGEHITSGLR